MRKLVLLVIFFLGYSAHATKVVAVGRSVVETSVVNYSALQELSRYSDEVWSAIVKERGLTNAKLLLRDAKKLDPRILEIYQNLAQLIISSKYDSDALATAFGGRHTFSYEDITGERMSPLLRHVARSLSLGTANLMHKKLDRASKKVPTKYLTDFAIGCAIVDCDQSTYFNYSPYARYMPRFDDETLNLGKTYHFANKIATADFEMNGDGLKCEQFLDLPTSEIMLFALMEVVNRTSDHVIREVTGLVDCRDYKQADARMYDHDVMMKARATLSEVALAYTKKAL